MTSVYPFLSIIDAGGIRITTYTVAETGRPVLQIAVKDEQGGIAANMHVVGISADIIERLVAAAAEPATNETPANAAVA